MAKRNTFLSKRLYYNDILGQKNKGELRSPFPLLDTMALSPIRRIIAFSPYISTDFNTFHQNKMYIDKYKKWVYS
jgi:hypothetical protein